jgi:hypothetical protein
MTGRRFANLVLILAALLALLGALLIAPAGPAAGGTSNRIPFITALCVLAALFVAGMRLPVGARIVLGMTLLSTGVGAYAMEGFLRWQNASRVRHAARKLGNSFDPRMRLEVLLDLRLAGIMAWPLVFPGASLGHPEPALPYPLGGISSVTTVHCNETGSYLIYRSDEHGFQNPAGTWTANPLEVAIVGDSFAQGNCVESSQNAAARIRSVFPATLNLGMEGDGPLTELAAIREFLPELRPEHVVWVFCAANDLIYDLPAEMKNPVLKQYLNPGFRQNLASRQQEVDAMLQKRASGLLEEATVARKKSQARWDYFAGWLRLRMLRHSAGLRLTVRKPVESVDLELFRRILLEARDTIASWNGRLFFVYLPSQEVFLDPDFARDNEGERRRILSLLQDLGIPVIDLRAAFEAVPDPNSLYAIPGAHLNPAGYDLMGKTIAGALKSATP